MLELFEQINKIVSEFGIGVLLINKEKKIQWTNDYILRKFESKGNPIGKNIDEVFKNNDSCLKLLDTAFNSNEIERIVTPFEMINGEPTDCRVLFVPVRENGGNIEHILALIINLSKREQLAYDILKKKEFLSNIVQNSADAIISLDSDGKINSWNKGAEVIFGYKPEEVIGRKLDFLLPQYLIEEKELEWIENAVLKNGAIVNYESERVTKSGKKIVAELTKTLLKNEKK